MPLIQRFRLPAVFCALLVLFCDLACHPVANISISDDWPYILSAHTLATTGHIVYNGWATAMLGWQLFLGALFIKLFGFSPTVVRMSTVLVAMALAFVLQRCLVRCNITERNATLATLALVLSPLYLMLSVTYMTDINGLFAIVLCLYGCLRAVQAAAQPATIAWICFAVASNAICGSSRQIAWLGVLVMVPSTLWLLRSHKPSQPRVFLSGLAAFLAGSLFIFGCIYWLNRQPYAVPEHLFVSHFSRSNSLVELYQLLLDVPFTLLPITALFLPQLRKSRPQTLVLLAVLLFVYLLLAIHPHHLTRLLVLEPALGPGSWVGIHGVHEGMNLHGQPPVFLHTPARLLLSFLSLGGLLGFVASLRHRRPPAPPTPATAMTLRQLTILLVPFTLAYLLLLVPRSTFLLYDRYIFGLLLLPLVFAVRFYQDSLRPRLPVFGFALVAISAAYGIVVNHNQFMLFRARLNLAAQIRSAGIPDTSVDNGWEYGFMVELQHSPYLNEGKIVTPANAFHHIPDSPPNQCQMSFRQWMPHITPLYGVSFDPNLCDGPAPIAPLTYPRWFGAPVTLYVVRYTPATH